MAEVVLRATDVVKEYRSRRGPPVRALRGVSVALPEARTLGVVGESGCGKSTLARVLVGLEPATSGRIELMGELAGGQGGADLARRIQLVFQDPFSSLNPRLTVSTALNEVLAVHHLVAGRTERRRRTDELLGMVALAPRFLERYPHELSGGQAQRVAIARALAVEPRLLVLDEPTSALDVSVRAEVMNLLSRLQDQLALSYVFISHDLAMVRHISDTISVMYLGKVVESGPYEAVLGAPLHPYTRALAEAVPLPDPEVEAGRRKASAGEVGSLGAEPPAGCPYHPRCPLAEDICHAQIPELLELRPGHEVACHVAARETTALPAAAAPTALPAAAASTAAAPTALPAAAAPTAAAPTALPAAAEARAGDQPGPDRPADQKETSS
jgi:oligopeptide/dipeptide ABC transporter ATP-binding protein